MPSARHYMLTASLTLLAARPLLSSARHYLLTSSLTLLSARPLLSSARHYLLTASLSLSSDLKQNSLPTLSYPFAIPTFKPTTKNSKPMCPSCNCPAPPPVFHLNQPFPARTTTRTKISPHRPSRHTTPTGQHTENKRGSF